MAEKKLSEELRHCLKSDNCYGCKHCDVETIVTCPRLLKKAYEVVKRYEEMFPCKVGDKLYCPNQYTKMIAVFEVVEIYTFKDGTVIIDDLENEWTIEDIGKTVFLTRPEAEQALKEMDGMKIYKIKSISHSGTKGTRGLPRTDGRYPLRIGRTVRLDMEHITVGIPLILEYVKDENGNDYSGYYLRCSIIYGIHFIGDKCGCIETNNTIYEFEKESEGKDNE